MAKENELFAVRSTWVSLFSLSLFSHLLYDHTSLAIIIVCQYLNVLIVFLTFFSRRQKMKR